MNKFNQTSAPVSLGKRLREDTNIFHPIYYKTTGTGNWYEQDLEFFEKPSFPIESIPTKVQVEYCFKAKILSDYLLTFRNKSGYMNALTGLRKTLMPDWYYGDLRAFVDGQTITSLVLVQFSPDKSVFRLYLFEKYYPAGRKRIRDIIALIREIVATGRPPAKILNSISQGNQGAKAFHSPKHLKP